MPDFEILRAYFYEIIALNFGIVGNYIFEGNSGWDSGNPTNLGLSRKNKWVPRAGDCANVEFQKIWTDFPEDFVLLTRQPPRRA